MEFSANGIMGIQDFQSIIYSMGLATVIGAYFSECLHIAIHLGGACIAAVGTSILCMSLQNIPKGFKTIQNGTKTIDLMTQCQSIADGFSDMIANGTITSIVIGMNTCYIGYSSQRSILVRMPQHHASRMLLYHSAMYRQLCRA